MTKNNVLTLAVLALLAAALSGCGALSYFTEKTFSAVTPPAMSKPAHSLAGKTVVVLVDAAPGLQTEGTPQVALRVAQAVARELADRKAAAAIVNPQDVAIAAQSDPQFGRKSVVDIGREFQADCVVYLVLQSFVLTQATGAESFNGYISVGVRVIDVKAGAQIWPAMDQVHFLDAASTAGIKADSQRQAEQVLLAGLARKVGMLFVSYNLEEAPRGAEVK